MKCRLPKTPKKLSLFLKHIIVLFQKCRIKIIITSTPKFIVIIAKQYELYYCVRESRYYIHGSRGTLISALMGGLSRDCTTPSRKTKLKTSAFMCCCVFMVRDRRCNNAKEWRHAVDHHAAFLHCLYLQWVLVTTAVTFCSCFALFSSHHVE